MQLSENNLFQSMRQPQSDWRSYQKNNNNNNNSLQNGWKDNKIRPMKRAMPYDGTHCWEEKYNHGQVWSFVV